MSSETPGKPKGREMWGPRPYTSRVGPAPRAQSQQTAAPGRQGALLPVGCYEGGRNVVHLDLRSMRHIGACRREGQVEQRDALKTLISTRSLKYSIQRVGSRRPFRVLGTHWTCNFHFQYFSTFAILIFLALNTARVFKKNEESSQLLK